MGYSLACVLWEIVSGEVPYQSFITEQGRKQEEERKRKMQQQQLKAEYGSVKLGLTTSLGHSVVHASTMPAISLQTRGQMTPLLSSSAKSSSSSRGGEEEGAVIRHII